jgi:hypothetical protein
VANALAAPTVAAAAGMTPQVWTNPSHVFGGEVGNFIGGRNRGRLPFVQFKVDGWQFSQESRQGGTVTGVVHLVVHVGGRDPLAAGDMATAIMQAAIASISDESVDNFTAASRQVSISALKQGPWGHEMIAEITIDLSYDEGDFAVTLPG